jgi:hypothetical protein
MSEENIPYVTYDIDHLINDKELEKRVYFKNNKMYNIINSSKTSSSLQEYRSVVFSFPENKMLSFSPPRSVPYEKFKNYPKNDNDSIIMSEIVEGVMINLFYDHRISSWEIATKCAIGGDYNFSGKKNASFREMFFECLHCEKNDEFLDALPKNYSYSFVIQHPKNKIILSIVEPKLYLVAIYAMYEDNSIMAIPSIMYEDWEIFKSMHVPIYFPMKYAFHDFMTLKVELRFIKNDPTHLGFMLYSMITGDRCTLRNPAYYNIKKQEMPLFTYHFFCIQRTGKLDEFLQIFPNYQASFSNVKKLYEKFIGDVYLAYIENYVEKQDKLIHGKFLPHIQFIHKTIYLPSLKSSEKTIITRKKVHEYFDAMDPRELLYHIYYDRRNA